MKEAKPPLNRRVWIISARCRFEQQKMNAAASRLFIDFLLVDNSGQNDSKTGMNGYLVVQEFWKV